MYSNIKVTTNPVDLVTTQSTHKKAPQQKTPSAKILEITSCIRTFSSLSSKSAATVHGKSEALRGLKSFAKDSALIFL